MRRRDFIGSALSFAGLLASRPGRAEPDVTVGYLSQGDPNVIHGGPFWHRLCELGWCGPRRARVLFRSAPTLKGVAEVAAELVASSVKVIVAAGEPATRIAMQATSQIPIVFIHVSDPVGRGLVGSIGNPAGNLTGFAMLHEAMSKSLQIVRELMPAARAVAYLFDPANTPEPVLARESEQYASLAMSLGLSYREFRAHSRSDIEAAIRDAKASGIDALIVEGSPDLVANRFVVTQLSNQNGIPVIGRERQFAKADALITFGEHFDDQQRQAAEYVDRLLRGARVSELPIQFTSNLELVVNLRVARAFGLDVPPALLARADDVID